ncbi:MBL fold metallo-hydrolase [Anaeromyxobacter sp. PSR-1]|uniref:MBL fold metallo-hydrolase n=1 Tax=Anaeromyxobacter sp. PSR-1 TaxID=1300915 RepID=UPI0005DD8453|nr:MBL fold metallo-hydrolase [Anaeromyxobacter sp. PSR-1]GAO01447.1 hypothetical protein PSR1_00301 [Anaeromyxobacter sp. PSR-1]
MIEVERVQRPVGQGGFHTCGIRVDGDEFRYVYDCGSVQLRALSREVDAYSQEMGRGQNIDVLALSHLDNDHVNGVEQLLASHDAETVVVPYLHPWDRLLLVAQACAAGTLTESYFALLANPARWFTDRGTSNVVFVLPAGPDGPSPVRVPENIPPERRKRERRVGLDGARTATEDDCTENPGLPTKSQVVSAGDALHAVLKHLVIWQLVPYTHPERDRLSEFAKRVSVLLNVPVLRQPHSRRFFTALKKALSDKRRRAELGDAYEMIREDKNLASMALYSGPAWSGAGARSTRFFKKDGYWWDDDDDDRPAWIGTGDCVFIRQKRVEAFARCFGQVFRYVGAFVVPHHGSKHNFAGHLLKQELHGISWVLPYGRNSYDHPWPGLVAALNRRGAVARVREYSTRAFTEHIVFG